MSSHSSPVEAAGPDEDEDTDREPDGAPRAGTELPAGPGGARRAPGGPARRSLSLATPPGRSEVFTSLSRSAAGPAAGLCVLRKVKALQETEPGVGSAGLGGLRSRPRPGGTHVGRLRAGGTLLRAPRAECSRSCSRRLFCGTAAMAAGPLRTLRAHRPHSPLPPRPLRIRRQNAARAAIGRKS